jgi:hypothetical protein
LVEQIGHALDMVFGQDVDSMLIVGKNAHGPCHDQNSI